MSKEHVIADELLATAQLSFSRGENWVAYNTIPYFLDKGSIYFFKTADEAHEFSDNNISEYDNYRVLHACSTDQLLKQIPYGIKFEETFNHSLKNQFTMNEKNFEYLKDNLKYLGFGEKQHEELEKLLKAGKDSFQMTFKTEVNKKPFEAVLQFRKSDNSDMYFLNSYHASLERSNGQKMEQTFYLNNGKGVTAKEAYNLLEGRAVHKELTNKAGEPYKAWIQLDFSNKDKNNNNEVKQYHENYGYDLKETLRAYPIKEMMKEEDQKSLLRSLEKGNVQMVTLELPDKDMKIFMEANPQFKTLTLYDEKMKRMDRDQREELTQMKEVGSQESVVRNKEGKGQDEKEQVNKNQVDKARGKEQKESKDKKQGLGQEEQPEKKQSKGRKLNSAPEENGLVTKKRVSTRKGLSL